MFLCTDRHIIYFIFLSQICRMHETEKTDRFMKSLNTLILLTITGIVCFTITILMLTVQWQTASIIQDLQKSKAENLLHAVTSTVENAYYNIQFHSKAILEQRKKELQHEVDIAHATLQTYHNQFTSGKYTLQQVKHLANQAVKNMRWANEVGYFWINNTTLPIPRMIMHPTLPELDGTILDDPVFACALGENINLFSAAVQVSLAEGSGYIDYLWPKPTPDGKLTNKQPKISFVRIFKPWQWVIGSGVYIDDIDTEVRERIQSTISELRRSFKKIHIGDNGYMFIFNNKKEMLIHPNLEGQNGTNIINSETGNMLLDEIMQAAETHARNLDYKFQKPINNTPKLYSKKLYVNHFEPLNWYICVSYYTDEINKPVNELSRKLVTLSALFLLVAILLSLLLSKYLGAPLKKLARAAEAIGRRGIGAAEIPISGSIETRELGQILNGSLKTIKEHQIFLRESEQKYRQVVENSNDAIFIVQNGNITFSNSKLQKLTGYSAEEIVSIPVQEVIHPKDRDAFQRQYFRASENNDRISFHDSFKLIDKKENEYIVMVSTVQIEWENKAATLFFARDITEMKKLETAFHQAQKMEAIGTLAGGISHDFNNLLMGILGRASLISAEPNNSEKILQHSQAIENYVQSATNLTKQLLGITRGGRYNPKPIDINKLLLSTSTMFGRTQKKLQICTKIDPEPIVVEADKHQIEQVLLNIYVNASQAMPGGGELHLQTSIVTLDEKACKPHQSLPGIFAHISITDTGTGMDEKTLQRIFDPFFTTKEMGRGTGLGLASAFGIIKNHKGIIACYSEIGLGTTFNLYLPLSSSQAIDEHLINEKILTGSEKILLVDDEKVIIEVAEEMLKKIGYHVMTAHSGKEALAIMEKEANGFDLAIIDMIMPGMDGETLFHKIRKRQPNLPVILASGYALNQQAASIMKNDSNGFLQKPFSLSTLSQLIRSVLEEKEKESASRND